MDNNRWWTTVRRLLSFLMAAVLTWGLVGCSNGLPFRKGDNSARPSETPQALNNQGANPQLVGQLSEVAPPPVIQKLSQSLEAYQPQVAIVSPTADEVVQDTTVSVRFQVRDLPVFKNPDLGMGPHLHVILDNQPYQAVYDLDQPLVLEDLPPGTHTLRVFASRPWHESFKNEGAYAQTTFHVFTKSTDNNPDPEQPLLTYSRPTGSYGAEPIMLDFYLTNAPLHLVAQENPDDDIADWRIRVTINGESFVLDRWESVYLKGFKQGKNWVKLEFIDEQGNPVKNVFNDTVRVITYEPQGKDTLSQLVRGELSAAAAGGIVDPNYNAAPTPTPSPAVTPSPTVTPEPIPSVAPSVEATPEEKPTPEPETPAEEPTPSAEAPPTLEPEVSPTPSESPTPVEEPTPAQEAAPTTPVTSPKPWFKGFFNPFRRPTAAPSPAPDRTEQEITPDAPARAIAPEEPQQTPEPEVLPTPSESPATVEEPTPTEAATPTITPSESPVSPEEQETSPSEPIVVPETLESPAETTPQPEESPSPSESPAVVEEPTPAENQTPKAPATTIKSWFKGFFNPFRQPTDAPSAAPEGLEQETPSPVPARAIAPEEPQQTPEPEALPTPSESPATAEEPTPAEATTPTTTSSESPASPEVLEPPSTEPIVVPETTEPAGETTPQPEESVTPSEPTAAVEESTPPEKSLTPNEPATAVEEASPVAKPVTPQVELPPVTEAVPVRPIQPEQSKADGLPPTLPEIVETPSPELSEPEAASFQPVPESSAATPQDASPKPDSPSKAANNVP